MHCRLQAELPQLRAASPPKFGGGAEWERGTPSLDRRSHRAQGAAHGTRPGVEKNQFEVLNCNKYRVSTARARTPALPLSAHTPHTLQTPRHPVAYLLGVERGDAGQHLALEELERGAAARGAEGHLVLHVPLGRGGRRVAAADDAPASRSLELGHGLEHGLVRVRG